MGRLFFICCLGLGSTTLFAQNVDRKTVNYYQELQMDIYQPVDKSGDTPVLLYVHGGGFSGGSRDSKDIIEFCTRMTSENLTVVSISYRLLMKGKGFGCNVSAREKMQMFADSGLDGARATAYLIDHAEELGIDPGKIILSGSSAGAEAVLHLAYWNDAQNFDNKPVLPQGFRYAGVLSFAGALIDDQLITSENAIPTMMVHGTCDNLVPYGYSPHHYCDEKEPGYLMLHGGGSLSKRLSYLNKPYYLITVCGGNHSWAGRPMNEMLPEIKSFIEDDIINGEWRQEHRMIKEDGSCEYPNASVCGG